MGLVGISQTYYDIKAELKQKGKTIRVSLLCDKGKIISEISEIVKFTWTKTHCNQVCKRN